MTYRMKCQLTVAGVVLLAASLTAILPAADAGSPAATQTATAPTALEITWVRKTAAAAWCRRDSMGEVVFDGKMWLLGGYTPGRINDVWCSADGVDWTCVTKAAAWPERNLPCSVVFNNRMWLFGGFAKEGKASYNDIWCSRDGKRWDLAAEHAPWSPRGAAGAAVFDGKLWITGGFDYSDFKHNSEVWCSVDGKEWRQVTANAPWPPRAMHGCVIFDGKLWIVGGGEYNTAFPANTKTDYGDVWSSSDGKNWRQVTAAAAWPARRFHGCVVYDNKIWVLGGYHQGNSNDVWFSSDGKTWAQATSPQQWSIRHEPACLVFKGSLWVLGGFGDTLFIKDQASLNFLGKG